MNFNFLDIVLYQKNPEIFLQEFPEKYENIQVYLSQKKNREQFFSYIDELEIDKIQISETDNESLNNEFEVFWTEFSKKTSGKKTSLYPFKIPLLIPVTSVFSFFVGIFLYVDHFFFAKYNLVRSLFISDEIVFHNSLFSFTGYNKGYSFLIGNFIYALFLLTLTIYFLTRKQLQKKFAVLLSLLFPIGVLFCSIWDIQTSQVLPEFLTIFYLFMNLIFLSVCIKKYF